MNIKLTLAAALLLTATPVLAQSAKSEDAKTKAGASSNSKMTVVSRESLDGDDGQQSSFELRIEDGKVISAKRNGKEIPADQIRREADGRIVIVDENGKEIEGLNLFQGAEGGAFFNGAGAWRGFRLGDGVDGEGNGFFQLGDAQEGPAPKVMLGVHMTEPGAALEKHLHLNPGKCAMITGVFEGLPAEVAGIGEYDVIVRIDDSDEADAATIRKILSSKDAGDTIILRVIQAGESKDLKVKLQPFDAEKLHTAKLIGKEPGNELWTGLDPLKDMAIDLKGLENLDALKGHVFVAPQNGDWQKHLEALQPHWDAIRPQLQEIQPQVDEAIKNALKNYEGAIKLHQGDLGGEKNAADVEAQLDRLDKRMAQLEEMLHKLLEQRQPKLGICARIVWAAPNAFLKLLDCARRA
jgi:hypothetical protein